MAYKTGNPALNSKTFDGFQSGMATGIDAGSRTSGGVMTLQGTVVKSGVLLTILTGTAGWVWHLFSASANVAAGAGAIMPWLIGGSLGGFIVALILCFNKTAAPYLSPVYAALEGLVLGGISAVAEAQYPGIAIQATGLTIGTFAALLLAYSSRLIKPTENFKLGVVAATGGIAIVYIVSLVLGMFGMHVPLIHSSGPIGIGFSCFIVIVAALNLVLDFDFIEQGAEQGAPKFMEWYAAFGLLVTLVWLYMEILRLLMKTRRN